MIFLVLIIYGLITVIATMALNKKTGRNYNVILYGVYTVLFGLIFGLGMLFGKFLKDNETERGDNRHVGSTVAYIIAGIMMIYNVFTIISNII